MVEAYIDDVNHTGRIILGPNQSWTWRANLALFYAFSGISFTFACWFLWVGLWLVLIYVIAEILLLAYCIHYCYQQGRRREVLTVSNHQVLIQKGINKPTEQALFQRDQAYFLVRKANHPYGSTLVSIQSSDNQTTLGRFLNQADIKILIEHLTRLVAG